LDRPPAVLIRRRWNTDQRQDQGNAGEYTSANVHIVSNGARFISIAQFKGREHWFQNPGV
jgi:hypothetical protein